MRFSFRAGQAQHLHWKNNEVDEIAELEKVMSTLRLHHDGTATFPAAARRAPTGATRAVRTLGQWFARLGERFDAWTDNRDELEHALAGAQNIADLESRMRDTLASRRGLYF
jgi:hypothetical protein